MRHTARFCHTQAGSRQCPLRESGRVARGSHVLLALRGATQMNTLSQYCQAQLVRNKSALLRRHKMRCTVRCLSTGVPASSAPASRIGARPSLLTPAKKRGASVVPTVVSPDHTTFDLLDIDSYTESIRKDLRTVFDHDRWVSHRSPSRYLRHTLGLFQSRMLLGMAPPLLYVLGVATFVCGYQNAFKAGLLPACFPNLQISFGQLGQLLGLTAFALSLLLVFRTNASYERWDSARKMWGMVLNRSRDLVRQGLAWIPKERTKLRAMLCRWVPAFAKTMMCHLRRDEDLEKELKGILQPHEIAAVVNATHRPIYALQVLTEVVKAARLPTAVTAAMEGNLVTFEDSLGGCERILRTPIPLSYATHTSRFMVMWLTLLPFTLYSTLGWGTVPVCGIVAFLLLGIKEITVSIEEPFSILALETITNTILTNVMELQSVHDTQLDSGNGNGNGNGKVAAMPASTIVALAEEDGNGQLPLALAAALAMAN